MVLMAFVIFLMKSVKDLYIAEWFSMMNIFTSKTKIKDLEKQMKNFYRLARSYRQYGYLSVPTGLSLSGTPLNEAILALHQILPQFKKENKLQKVQMVFLVMVRQHL